MLLGRRSKLHLQVSLLSRFHYFQKKCWFCSSYNSFSHWKFGFLVSITFWNHFVSRDKDFLERCWKGRNIFNSEYSVVISLFSCCQNRLIFLLPQILILPVCFSHVSVLVTFILAALQKIAWRSCAAELLFLLRFSLSFFMHNFYNAILILVKPCYFESYFVRVGTPNKSRKNVLLELKF